MRSKTLPFNVLNRKLSFVVLSGEKGFLSPSLKLRFKRFIENLKQAFLTKHWDCSRYLGYLFDYLTYHKTLKQALQKTAQSLAIYRSANKNNVNNRASQHNEMFLNIKKNSFKRYTGLKEVNAIISHC